MKKRSSRKKRKGNRKRKTKNRRKEILVVEMDMVEGEEVVGGREMNRARFQHLAWHKRQQC